jgi:hypothetical protein
MARPSTPQVERRPVFVWRLVGRPRRTIRDLRNVLKLLLRRHGLTCVDAREVQSDRDHDADGGAL